MGNFCQQVLKPLGSYRQVVRMIFPIWFDHLEGKKEFVKTSCPPAGNGTLNTKRRSQISIIV